MKYVNYSNILRIDLSDGKKKHFWNDTDRYEFKYRIHDVMIRRPSPLTKTIEF